MKVSIITPVFNGAKTLENTLCSILGQNYSDIESVVIDGGSSDGTLEILNRYQNKITHWISEPDRGLYDAINKGIQLAKGEVIAALNSDDIYADDTIVSQVVAFIQNHRLDAAYGDLVYVDPDNRSRVTRFWKAGRYRKGAFRYGWVIPHPTFFCKRDIFEKYGDFDPTFQIAGDFELMLRLIERHQIKIGYLPLVLVRMAKGGKANVLSGIIQGNREILKAFRINGFRLPPEFFIFKPILKICQFFTRPLNDTVKSPMEKFVQK